MTIETAPGSDLVYYLVSYDKNGDECTDDQDAPDGRLSDVVAKTVKDEPITDVFLISHGWKGDIPAAKRQFNAWIGAMGDCANDLQEIKEIRPGYRPLLVGLHWPSLPWGEETQSPDVSFSRSAPLSLDDFVEDAAKKIADSARAKAALRSIFIAANDNVEPEHLPKEISDAYSTLIEEAGLAAAGPAAGPGDDADPFDPEQAYQQARMEDALSFGGSLPGGILEPLRQISFWKMKKRARIFGESGAASLLRRLQNSVADVRNVRFHLMGHSFGCIVVSATVAGAGGDTPLPKPVDTIYLVQGALSLWSYCSDIPVVPGKEGYFHDICRDQKVAGPLLATHSEHDTAVGKLYPLAAGIRGQVDMAPGDLPKYGAVGTFGLRGPGVDVEDIKMGDIRESYVFEPGKIYNLESSEFISEGGGFSGAHNDIAKPEVAHAFWQAVMRAQ